MGPSGWIVPRTATVTTVLFGEFPQRNDRGAGQFPIDAILSINRVFHCHVAIKATYLTCALNRRNCTCRRLSSVVFL